MDFFNDGITEEIIFALAKIKELKVISRTSSFYFKDKSIDIQEIGEQLNVHLILEGNVRIRKSLLRISAQLIQVKEDAYLWSETWNRKLDDLFDIQDEISLLIADKIREYTGHLSIADHLVENQTTNLNAYKHYLKGRYHVNKWNSEDVHIAVKEFEQAAALDNQMIDAHVGIADAYSFLAVAGFAPREKAWAKATAALEKAEAINEHNAGLNYMLANQAFFTKADFATARKLALKSLANVPTFEASHRLMTFFYILNGEYQKAKQHLFYAKSVDPLNPETAFYEAFFYYQTAKYKDALKILDKLLEANKMNLPALMVTIHLKIKEGKWQEAQQLIQQTPEEMFALDERLGLCCLVEITKGNRTPSLLSKLEENGKDTNAHHAHSYLFIIYSMLGEFQKAYAILQNLFDHQSSILMIGFTNILSENIKQTPDYSTYFQKIYPPIKKERKLQPLKPQSSNEVSTQKDLAKLNAFMTAEQPFLNPTLSLRTLANSISIHPNQLSWLLNQVIGKNFNEYINQQRIEHFKKLVVNPSNSHISLLGLAYESGFNSKTVFNTAFKKEVGMTPKKYQKMHAK